MNNVSNAITALNAMNATVQSVMIAGSKPLIRIARSSLCNRLLAQGQASYVHIGHGRSGSFRQGCFLNYMAAGSSGQNYCSEALYPFLLNNT